MGHPQLLTGLLAAALLPTVRSQPQCPSLCQLTQLRDSKLKLLSQGCIRATAVLQVSQPTGCCLVYIAFAVNQLECCVLQDIAVALDCLALCQGDLKSASAALMPLSPQESCCMTASNCCMLYLNYSPCSCQSSQLRRQTNKQKLEWRYVGIKKHTGATVL